MLGLETPSEGRCLVDQIEARSDTLRDVRHRIGYVIQEGGLFPHLPAPLLDRFPGELSGGQRLETLGTPIEDWKFEVTSDEATSEDTPAEWAIVGVGLAATGAVTVWLGRVARAR